LMVDAVPFIGPPAWTVMVFFQLKFHLNIWIVLVTGVSGSAIGRYLLALYMPYLGSKVLNRNKEADLQFLGSKLSAKQWQMHSFVLLYTLVPLPSTPLFTVAGISKINPLRILPAFFAGKFLSDALMVYAGKYAAENIDNLVHGVLSWQGILSSVAGIILLFIILFINWRILIQNKKVRFNFTIWK
jgi:membrane protein DedA with SNARE-associated domain